MKTAKRFEELEVWQMARDLCREIWEVTQQGTFSKDFKLKDQINGSAGSVMDNIAEGYERNGNKELRQFLYIAKGSAGEMRSQLYRAFDRNHISQAKLDDLIPRATLLSQKLMNLIKSISTSGYSGYKYK